MAGLMGQTSRVTLAASLVRALVPAAPNGNAVAVQRDLAENVRAQADMIGPPDYAGLLRRIAAASVAERLAVLTDFALLHRLGRRLNDEWATTIGSALLVGTHTWRNPPANDFFRFFMMNQGPGPASPRSTMNCWESVMYAAYLMGVIDAAWIRSYYQQAIAQPDPNAAAYALLGWTPTLPTRDPARGHEPTTGQLVFYRTGGSGVPGHVAIYMGGGQIMSLWTQPRGVDSIQQVGITEIAGTIHYRDPPW